MSNFLKSLIVDSDGKIYIDSSLGDVNTAESAIAPFSRCVLRDPVTSSLYEYELVPEKIISAISSGKSLEEILRVFENFSMTPLPFNVFSDLKRVEESSDIVISGNVLDGFQVRSKNWKLLKSLARNVRRVSSWDTNSGFLSVPISDLPKLRHALSNIRVSGVDINCMIEEYELLFREGVPLEYVKECSGISITNAGECRVVVGDSSGTLERVILDARERVKADVSRVVKHIPLKLLDYVRKTLDNSSRGELWNDPLVNKGDGSILQHSLLFLKYLLTDDIDRGIASNGANYILNVHGPVGSRLPWRYVISVCRAKGWNILGPNEVHKSAVKIGSIILPERRVINHYKRLSRECETIKGFVLGGPGLRSIYDVYRDIGDRINDRSADVERIVGVECFSRLKDFFCKSLDLRDISRSVNRVYYEVSGMIINGVTILARDGILDGIISGEAREKLRAQQSKPIATASPCIVDPSKEPVAPIAIIGAPPIINNSIPHSIPHSISQQPEISEPVQKSPDVVNVSQSPKFVKRDNDKNSRSSEFLELKTSGLKSGALNPPVFNNLYQRCDVVEREWLVSLTDVRARMSVETLDSDNKYILLSEELLGVLSKLSPLDSIIFKSERVLPRRASKLLRNHFWKGTALFEMYEHNILRAGVVDEKIYSSLLQELEECVALSKIISRGLSPQFLRRRLFENGMDFVPLYKAYSIFGVPSSLVAGRFNDLVFSIGNERGIVDSNSNNELFRRVVADVRDYIGRFAGLLPPACNSVLGAIFNSQKCFDSEIDACSQIVGNSRDLSVEVLTGYDMLKHSLALSKKSEGIIQGSFYSRLRDVSAEYNVQQRFIRRLERVDVFRAGGFEYITMNQELMTILQRLSSGRKSDETVGSCNNG